MTLSSDPSPSPEVEASRTDVMSTDHGEVRLSLPCRMSSDDMTDLEEWLGIVIRTARRRTALAQLGAETGEGER